MRGKEREWCQIAKARDGKEKDDTGKWRPMLDLERDGKRARFSKQTNPKNYSKGLTKIA